jgi:hypothetical protein
MLSIYSYYITILVLKLTPYKYYDGLTNEIHLYHANTQNVLVPKPGA